MTQTAFNRYELTWNQFVKELETNPKITLRTKTESRYKKNLKLNPVSVYTKFWTVSFEMALSISFITFTISFVNTFNRSDQGNNIIKFFS